MPAWRPGGGQSLAVNTTGFCRDYCPHIALPELQPFGLHTATASVSHCRHFLGRSERRHVLGACRRTTRAARVASKKGGVSNFSETPPSLVAHHFSEWNRRPSIVAILSHADHPICDSEYSSEPLDDV